MCILYRDSTHINFFSFLFFLWEDWVYSNVSFMGQNIHYTSRGLIGSNLVIPNPAKLAILSTTRLQHLGTYWALKKLKLEAIPKAFVDITPLWARLTELWSKLSITHLASISKIRALIPKFLAKTNPSFTAMTSARRASEFPPNFFTAAVMNLPC